MKGIMLYPRATPHSHAPSAQHPVSSHRRSTGFSIIEMMIALVLIAIGSALALPSYQNMVEKRHLTRGAEQLLAFVNSAQSRSIQWNQRLNVSYSRTSDTEWCVGANLGDTVCNCTVTDTTSATYCDINDAPWIFDDQLAGDRVLLKAISGGDDWASGYYFDHDRGLVMNPTNNEIISGEQVPLTFEIHSSTQSYQLQLRVGNTGQASLCSEDSDHSIPGYSECPPDQTEEVVDSESTT